MLDFFRKIPFPYRVGVALGIPILIWALVTVAGLYALNESIENSEGLIDRQRSSLLATEYLLFMYALRDAERGYLLTSDDNLLISYRETVRRINALHAQLTALARGDQAQSERLDRAHALFQEWLYESSRERVQMRSGVSNEHAQRTREAKRHFFNALLAHALTETDDADPADVIAWLREGYNALSVVKDEIDPNDGRGDPLAQAAVHLERYASALENQDRETAASALHAFLRELIPPVRRAIDVDERIAEAVASSEEQLLFDNLTESIELFISAGEADIRQYRAGLPGTFQNMRTLVWIGFTVGLILMIVMAYWVVRRIRKSFEGINLAAEELAGGNLSARVDIESVQEMSGLATRFNAMAELVENRTRQTAVLSELGELLHSCETVDEALAVFGSFATRLFPDQPGVLYLVSEDRQQVDSVASWLKGESYSEESFKIANCWALRMTRVHENLVTGSPRCRHLETDDDASVCIPLPAFGELIGMLFVVTNANRKMSASQIHNNRQFSETTAEQLALAIANVRLRESLRHQSIRDPLTQLYNRRHMEEMFTRELYRAERRSLPLAVIVFDIDHFKRFNDEYGHEAGDSVLRSISNVLNDYFRVEDGLFRIGGEEFVVLLPETTAEDALERAEQMRERISARNLLHEGTVLPAVTISAGVAMYPEDGASQSELIKAADDALFQAKHTGRNRVIKASDLEEE